MQTREQAITRTSVIGIIINVFLVIFKALVGFLANSLTIMVDAVNNLTDVMSAVITIGGIKLAHKRADKEHPFGHGRFEYFSSILIALLVFGAGGLSLVESNHSSFTNRIHLGYLARGVCGYRFQNFYYSFLSEKWQKIQI